MSSNSHREDYSIAREDNSSESEPSPGAYSPSSGGVSSSGEEPSSGGVSSSEEEPSSGGVSSSEEEPSSGEVPSFTQQDAWPHLAQVRSALLSHLGLSVRPRILNEDDRRMPRLYRADEGLGTEEETSEDEEDSEYIYRDWDLEVEE